MALLIEPRRLLVIFFLLSITDYLNAFPSGASLRSKRSLRRATSIDDELQIQVIQMDTGDKTPQNILDLDQRGCLKIKNGPVLLDGLETSIWSGIPVISSARRRGEKGISSLFLHTTYSTERAQHILSLGNLVTCNRLLSCARLTRYWMGPAFGTKASDIPLDTQFLLVEMTESGPYALILPLVDGGFRASLEYSDQKQLSVVCYSESGDGSSASSGMRALYVAVGDDPFELVKKGIEEVADNMRTFRTLDQKTIPSSVNDFGWCTWDAFYSKVNPTGILEGVKALREAGVPPRNLILDDGWQEVTPHPPDWKKEDEKSKRQGTFTRLGNAAFGKIAAFFTAYYDSFVQRAPHGSLPNRVWTLLSKTVIKKGLWEFFDSETDFNRQLDSFEPNFKFQSADGNTNSMSLADLVTELKVELGLKRVYCWHAIHGYWRGVSNEIGHLIGVNVTQILTKPTRHLKRIEPQMGFDTTSLFGVGILSSESDLSKFYHHLHLPLVKAGIDGVKVDVQSGVSAAGSGVNGGPHVAQIYTEAMEKSVAENFPSENSGAVNCINCMCHSTENLYRYKVTAIARASDDFYPTRPESHSVHLVNVAYNSLFLGEICLPDWDMFHSQHESAELHAAARSVGGCPVYVSDVPGKHNISLLKKLALPDGSILRAKLPGRPTRDCLFADVGKDGESALKIWNENTAGGGVIGAFNVQGVAWNFHTNENEEIDTSPSSVVALVKPYDVEPLRKMHGSFAVWKHRSSSLEVLSSGNSYIETTLEHRSWEIFTISHIQKSGNVEWAPIGLGDMLNSGGAILHQGTLEETTAVSDTTDDGLLRQTIAVTLTVRGPGRFVAYCKPAPSTIIIDNAFESIPSEPSFTYDTESGLLQLTLPAEKEGVEPFYATIAWDNP